MGLVIVLIESSRQTKQIAAINNKTPLGDMRKVSNIILDAGIKQTTPHNRGIKNTEHTMQALLMEEEEEEKN